MNQHNDHSKNWGASDFARYYSGQMDKPEMYALEKDALSDPFLQDAFEGYKNTATAREDIEELQKKLEQHKTRKLAPIAWYRQKNARDIFKIAATVFLFVSLAWLFYHNKEELKTESAPNLAQLKTEPKQEAIPKESAPAAMADSSTASPEMKLEEIKNTTEVSSGNSLKRSNTEAVKKDENAEPGKISKEISDDQLKTENKETKTAEQPRQSPMPGLSSDKNYSGIVNNMPQNTFSGNVKDPSGEPVPHAVVYDVKTKNAVHTDANGRFMIKAGDSAIHISVNAIGYQPSTETITSGDIASNNIVLQKSTEALSEVVVTSANKTAKKSSISSSNVRVRGVGSINANAEPVYVVNSQVMPAPDFKQIPPGAIKSLQLINEKNATALYGAVGANGVILVTLKENTSLHHSASVTLKNASMISGEQAFYQFAKDSLIAVGNKKILELKFDTDDAGKPVRIAVKKSVCGSCDNKAIQMLHLATWQKLKKDKKAELQLRF